MTTTTFPQQPATKTQINNLQRGHGRLGIIGTNYDIRNEVAWRVKHENPEVLNVRYNGREYSLKYSQSLSGKSFWYTSDALPLEIIREVVPFDPKLREPENICLHLSIDSNMFVEWHLFHRKSANAQWKFCKPIEIAERDITIL